MVPTLIAWGMIAASEFPDALVARNVYKMVLVRFIQKCH